MNRIQSFAELSTLEASTPDINVEAAQYRRSTGGVRHAMFAPLHYERNYAYPLIVWLHGPADDERQLRRIMPLVSMRNYVAVAPCGTTAMVGRSEQPALGWSQSADHISQAESRVLACLSTARESYNISPTRIFLAGYECGGTMAMRLALRAPQTFAGVLSLGGEFPQGHMPLSRLVEVRRLPWFLATQRDSLRYPPQAVCENLRLMYSAGLSVNLRQYPCGDELTTCMLSDMDRWIMEQIASPRSVSSAV